LANQSFLSDWKILYWRTLLYCMRQIIRGGKLSQFLWIFANCKCFTIENFPWILVPSTNYTKHVTTSSYKQRAKHWNVMWHVAYYIYYHFFNSYCISISWISLFPLTNQLFSNYWHPAHMITMDKTQFWILLFLLP